MTRFVAAQQAPRAPLSPESAVLATRGPTLQAPVTEEHHP